MSVRLIYGYILLVLEPVQEEKEANRDIYYIIISQVDQIMCIICVVEEKRPKHMVIIG